MIKYIRNVLLACVFSLATTPLMAASGDFSGPYVSFGGTIVGGALDGEHTDQSGEITEGTGGAVFPIGQIEAGWSIGIGDYLLLGIGGSYNAGKARLSRGDDAADAADLQINAGEQWTFFVQPSISFATNSSVYAKFGLTQVELECVGDIEAHMCNNVDGGTIAIGTKTKFSSGVYIQTEAGATRFEEVDMVGIGGSGTAKLTIKPTSAFGTVAIGFQF